MNNDEHLPPHEAERVTGLYADLRPTESFEERVVAGLGSAGILDGTHLTLSWRRIAVQVAAAVVVFAVGVVVGEGRSVGGDTSTVDPDFVLLLHDAPGAPSVGSPGELELVEAYTRWASDAARRTGGITGLRLSDEVELLAPSSLAPPNADIRPGIVGFFTVPAQTWDEAVQLAQDHPHRSTGGWVEVRRIAPID